MRWTASALAVILPVLVYRETGFASSMNRFVAIFTAATALTHSLFGCCAGHVHDSACSETPLVAAVSHGHHHDSHPSDHPQHHGQTPDDDHDCCSLKCQWLAPQAGSKLALDLLSHAVIFDADHLGTTTFSATSRSDISLDDTMWSPPLRAHLVLGVLLI